MFQVQADQLPPSTELMAEANSQLGELAIRAQMESALAMQRQQAVEEEKKELQKQNESLQQQAFFDALTGVYNRKFFDEALMREINRCSRDRLPVGVVFADLDHFKNLNDNHGHRCGDLALHRVGQLMKGMLRNSDLVARYGGEEFVVLVHNPTEDGIMNLSERIRGAIEAERFSFGSQTICMTASIGAALATPDLGESGFADKLVETADQAMYESKRRGRNQVNIRSFRKPKSHDSSPVTAGA
jgi:diguanylate cyclase (GGDEF)-like protein